MLRRLYSCAVVVALLLAAGFGCEEKVKVVIRVRSNDAGVGAVRSSTSSGQVRSP